MGLLSLFFRSSTSEAQATSASDENNNRLHHGRYSSVHGIAWDDLSEDEGGYTLVRSKALSYAEVTAQNLPNVKSPTLSRALPANSRLGRCDAMTSEMTQCGATSTTATPPHCQTQLDEDEGGSRMSDLDSQFLELETVYLGKDAHRKQRWRESMMDGKTIKHRRHGMNERRANRFIVARHCQNRLI